MRFQFLILFQIGILKETLSLGDHILHFLGVRQHKFLALATLQALLPAQVQRQQLLKRFIGRLFLRCSKTRRRRRNSLDNILRLLDHRGLSLDHHRLSLHINMCLSGSIRLFDDVFHFDHLDRRDYEPTSRCLRLGCSGDIFVNGK